MVEKLVRKRKRHREENSKAVMDVDNTAQAASPREGGRDGHHARALRTGTRRHEASQQAGARQRCSFKRGDPKA